MCYADVDRCRRTKTCCDREGCREKWCVDEREKMLEAGRKYAAIIDEHYRNPPDNRVLN